MQPPDSAAFSIKSQTECNTTLVEHFRPGWTQPNRREWNYRVLFLASFELCVVLMIGVMVKEWWQLPSVFEWDAYHPAIGGSMAYFVGSFFFYWWHRARHESDFLWRVFHQVHHSPGRLETLTAFYKHPIEAAANSLLSAMLVYLVFGLDLRGAAVYTGLTIAAQLLVHLNTSTPQVLGYFFQRPEMHRVHHQSGTEHLNYSDIPLWDMLFGTFQNRAAFSGNCGFTARREARLGDMLRFRDVHKKLDNARSRRESHE